MRYTVDTDNKIIRFAENETYKASELAELIEKFPDYTFSQPLILSPTIQPFEPYTPFPNSPNWPIQPHVYFGTDIGHNTIEC